MIILLWLVVFLAAFATVFYHRIERRKATTTFALLLLVCTLTSADLWVAIILWLLFALVATPLHVTRLRHRLITQPVFNLLRRTLPSLSETERTALDAGTVWWEGELFSGRPDWRRLEALPPAALSPTEQAFLDGPVQSLLDLCDEWQITHRDADLPEAAWQYIKDNKFWGMIIPKRYGGLEFSAYAHSCILARLGSGPAGATVSSVVAVPNSLGPAELLLHYGTDAQRDHYLPRLVTGEDIPCFALTNPFAGSDAGAIPDRGVVCHGTWDGENVIGMRLTWNKRYITLAPVATLLGLAFKLFDPDGLLGQEKALGITCALIPTDTPGCHTGRRHFPSSAPFQNGPTWGTDVFVPLDFIIGGREMIGQGWRMLMECLSAGRAISLPSAATGDAMASTRLASAYAATRQQFGVPIGAFEGVQDVLGRMGGRIYACESVRRFTANALDLGEKPAVASAIAKYHVTERARSVVTDAMDILAGKAVMLGPSNPVAKRFQATPVSITVEGANILTRSMMIYGQGAIRCHPFLLAEMEAVGNPDSSTAISRFDPLLCQHISHILGMATRSLVMGLIGGRLSAGGGGINELAPYYRTMNRYAANLALLSDIAMGTLGSSLKFRESLSARLGDMLAHLYVASAAIKRFIEDGQPDEDKAALDLVCRQAFVDIETAMDGVLRHLPSRSVAILARTLIFPLGRRARGPADSLAHTVADQLQKPGAIRDRLMPNCYLSLVKQDIGLALFERAQLAMHETQALQKKVSKARRNGTVDADLPDTQVDQAEAQGILSGEEADQLRSALALQAAVIKVDDFSSEEMRSSG